MAKSDMYAVFSGEIKPIVKIGDNLAIIPTTTYGYFRVKYLEPIQPFIHNFGSISAGSTETEKQPLDSSNRNKMEVGTNELAQFFLTPLDDIEIQVFYPKSVGRMKTKYLLTSISKYTDDIAHRQVFVFEDNLPFFNIKNPTNHAINLSRVMFQGFRYVLEKLTTKPENFTYIPLEEPSE